MSDYVSATEASEILECSDTLIRNRLRLGTLRGKKTRGKWMVLREDLARQPRPHAGDQQNEGTAEVQDALAEQQNSRTVARKNSAEEQQNSRTYDGISHTEWRDDLLAQVARLEASETALRGEADRREQTLRDEVLLVHQEMERRETAAGEREQLAKARIIDLERELTVRDSRNVDLAAQVSVLEAKIREVLEEGKSDSHQLANRIADLVQQHTDIQSRVLELEPVAAEVPMLQAAVADTKAELTEREDVLSQRERQLADLSDDIETIASRPVAGPVFRLLTKGKLRI
jgi:chromosome segregation ATPase